MSTGFEVVKKSQVSQELMRWGARSGRCWVYPSSSIRSLWKWGSIDWMAKLYWREWIFMVHRYKFGVFERGDNVSKSVSPNVRGSDSLLRCVWGILLREHLLLWSSWRGLRQFIAAVQTAKQLSGILSPFPRALIYNSAFAFPVVNGHGSLLDWILQSHVQSRRIITLPVLFSWILTDISVTV